MGGDWRCSPFEDAIAAGRSVAEVDDVLNRLDEAGLLLTPERLDEIAQKIARIVSLNEKDPTTVNVDHQDGLLIAGEIVREAARR